MVNRRIETNEKKNNNPAEKGNKMKKENKTALRAVHLLLLLVPYQIFLMLAITMASCGESKEQLTSLAHSKKGFFSVICQKNREIVASVGMRRIPDL